MAMLVKGPKGIALGNQGAHKIDVATGMFPKAMKY
jgi:hypothetical protein